MGYVPRNRDRWDCLSWAPPPGEDWYTMGRRQLHPLLFVRDILDPEQYLKGYLTVINSGLHLEGRNSVGGIHRVPLDVPIAHRSDFPIGGAKSLYHIPVLATPSPDLRVWQLMALFKLREAGFPRVLIRGGDGIQHLIDVDHRGMNQFQVEMQDSYVVTKEALSRDNSQGSTLVQHLDNLAGLYAPK